MIVVGTSGYNYPEWKGTFYPEKISARKMLPYYAARFTTVEVNYTFYRLPSEKTLDDWLAVTPDGFTFTLKASRRITHDARLKDCEELLNVFCERARRLDPKLGVLLFQLPPWLKKDLPLLEAFLDLLPADLRTAFEFHHKSWLSDDVFESLRDSNAALCIKDDEKFTTPLVATADYGYFRLRDEGYTDDDLQRWAGTIAQYARGLNDVFVYLKHEEKGVGPEFARKLIDRIGP